MKKTDDLRWIRVFTPDHVPHYLVEQVRDRDYSVDEFFKYHQINCMSQGENGVVLNPFSHLYVLADNENQVKGMLWFSVDPLSKDILIQTYSMDKEYWGKGLAVKKLAEHIKDIRKKGQLNKIYWVTNYPKHSERYGFKRSKSILMEYSEESHGKNNVGKSIEGNGTSDNGIKGIRGRRLVGVQKSDDGLNGAQGEHRLVDTPAAELPVQCDGASEFADGGRLIRAVDATV